MFDLEVFLYGFCYFDAICAKAIEIAAGTNALFCNLYHRSSRYVYGVQIL